MRQISKPQAPALPKLVTVVGLASIWFASGCGNEESGGTGGETTMPFSGAALCTLAFSTEATTGFVRLVADAELEAGAEIDSFEGAIEIAAGVSCAVWERAVFAASFETPTITRFDVIDGALVEGETVSFMNFGLSSLRSLSNQIQVFSGAKAYFVDTASSRIIVWNPTTMKTIEAIPLAGFEPPEGLSVSSIRADRIGDRVVLWGSYRNAQAVSVSRAVFAFVDPETDEVVTDTVDTCGGFISASVTTSNGDAYFGMGGAVAVEHALELPDSFEPCVLRVRAGANQVDRTYVGDLNALTGVGPTAGPFGGFATQGLVLAYDETAVPINPTLTPNEHTQIANWRFYEAELGSTQPAVLIEELPAGAGVAGSLAFDGRGFLTQFTGEFGTTHLFDLSERPIEIAFTVEGAVQLLARLEHESLSRTAPQSAVR